MRIANSGVIADKDSFDHILVAAQMWDKSFLPFEHEDDLDPELVRIALDCGHNVVNIDSLDRFVEKYPDYRLDGSIIFSVSMQVTPSEKFIEHVLRTSPDEALYLLESKDIVPEFGFDIVEKIVVGIFANTIDESLLADEVRKWKFRVVNTLLVRNGHESLGRIVSNPRLRNEMVGIIEGHIEPLSNALIKFIESPYSSVEFLEDIVEMCGDGAVGSAAQKELDVRGRQWMGFQGFPLGGENND